MEEKEMQYVIQKIRENEEKTQELTTVLEGFHQSFDKLLGNIERVLEVGTIDQATKSVRQLDTHLGHIEKKIVTYQTEDQEHMKELTDKINQMGVGVKNNGKGVGDVGNQPQKSPKCISLNDQFYIIREDRLAMNRYSTKGDIQQEVLNLEQPILSLATYDQSIYYHTAEEKMFKLGQESEWVLEEVVAYEMTAYGIVYQNKIGNIKLYKYDGMQKSLAKRVNYFEVVGNRFVLFQGTKVEIQMLDLDTLDVDHPINLK